MAEPPDFERTDPETTKALLEHRLRVDPSDHVARHNLGLTLRRLDRADEALEQVEKAIAGGLRAPETGILRAHLLGDLGRFDEAVAQYVAVASAHPEALTAHESLAKLLPQIGRSGEALISYRSALARAPRAGMLRVSALNAAKAVGDHEQLLAWAREARQIFGPDTMITAFEAMALGWLGEPEAAAGLLEPAMAADPDYLEGYGTLAWIQLKAGDPTRAAESAGEAVRRVPDDQSGWALLGTAWRLLGDPRQEWLLDHDNLVVEIDLPGLDLPALADTLTALHLTGFQPAEQSLRGGTQTRDDLFDKRDPAIRALASTIKSEVEARLAGLPRDDTHPFLRRNSGSILFTGSWSVRLRDQGFHINHIHPSGWLSSACYIALPPEMAGGGEQGALTFGVPDSALGIDLPPVMTIVPRPGQLVVFPSFFWHGTLPFSSASPRLTVAFDALPVDI